MEAMKSYVPAEPAAGKDGNPITPPKKPRMLKEAKESGKKEAKERGKKAVPEAKQAKEEKVGSRSKGRVSSKTVIPHAPVFELEKDVAAMAEKVGLTDTLIKLAARED